MNTSVVPKDESSKSYQQFLYRRWNNRKVDLLNVECVHGTNYQLQDVIQIVDFSPTTSFGKFQKIQTTIPLQGMISHISSTSGWWLNQPLWKICSSKWVHLPQGSGWKFQKYLSCHHLDKRFVLQLVLNRSAVASKTLAIEGDLIDSKEITTHPESTPQPTP